MPFSVLQTNRELLNKITGIDLFVSDFQEIPHRLKKSSFLYHVIVVTNLFYYKTRGVHKETENVQFMVSKTFDEFKELYQKLYDRFPSVIFPRLPPQTLIKTDNDAELKCMKEVLKIVASTQKLCSSPMVIRFLKGEPISKSTMVEVDETFDDISTKDVKKKVEATKDDIEDDSDLFTSTSTPSKEINQSNGIDNELDVDLKNDTSSKTNLFSDNTDYIPIEEPSKQPQIEEGVGTSDAGLFDDDSEDLLDVKEDVADIFSLLKTSTLIKANTKPSAPVRQRSLSKPSDENVDDGNENEDFFRKARTASIKREKKESKDLNDIFSAKNSGSIFDTEHDDDLFSSNVAAYIQQEEDKQTASLDL